MRKPRNKQIPIPDITPTNILTLTGVEENGQQVEIKVQILTEEEGESLKAQALDLWKNARLLAGIVLDTYAPAINALQPVPVIHPNMQTMGVDMFYRCYMSPTYVLGLEKAAKAVSPSNPCKFCGDTSHHPLAYIAGDIHHEAQHCLRQHGKRGETTLSLTGKKDEKWNRKMNIAADMEIDDEVKVYFDEVAKYMATNSKKAPKLCYNKTETVTIPLPSDYNLQDHHLMEFYYRNIPDPPPQGGDGGGRTCGSGATGVKQEYELGGPSDEPGDETPGVDELDQAGIQKSVAKNIQEHAKTRGIGALGSMLDWANKILPPPSYDWKKEFQREVKAGISRIFGHRNRNWNMPNKKSGSVGYDVIYPKLFTRTPRLLLVLDTSGSMYSRGRSALAEIEGICKSSRASVDVYCVDWDVYNKQAVKSVRDLKLQGGGGTSMKRGIEQIMEARRFKDVDLMVLITDGETDYPDKSTLRGIPLITAVVNERKEAMNGIPSWIKAVYVPVNQK